MARLLVVDDHEVLRDVLADALADAGHEVRTAPNGRAALALLESEWRPDLIVLDLMMPIMDGRGFRAAQRHVAGMWDTPVIILSAAHEIAAVREELGANACLPKPFALDVLLATIGEILALRATRTPQ